MCGIVAYIGKNTVDTAKFKLLLLLNKDRGEDSTGLCFNKMVYKTTESVDKFLVKTPINFPNEKGVVLGHVRKASVGYKKVGQAHPVAVYPGGLLLEQVIAETPEGALLPEPEFVLVMNGTVINIRELSEEYNTNYSTGDSDTEHIALILFKLGKEDYKEFFSKYEGACTGIFYWTNEINKVYVVKDIERPLFVYKDKKGDIWLSSKEDSLTSVCIDGAKKDFEIKAFKDNNIHIYKNNELTESISFTKLKKKVTYGGTNSNTGAGTNNFYNGHNNSANKYRFLSAQLKELIENSKSKFGVDIIYDITECRYYTRNGSFLDPIHGNHKLPMKTIEDKKVIYKQVSLNFIAGFLVSDDTKYIKLLEECPIGSDLVALEKYANKLASTISKETGALSVINYANSSSSYYRNGVMQNSLTEEIPLMDGKLEVTTSGANFKPNDTNIFEDQNYMNVDITVVNCIDIVAKSQMVYQFEELYLETLRELTGTSVALPEVQEELLPLTTFVKAFIYYLAKNYISNYDLLNFLWQSALENNFEFGNDELTDIFDELSSIISTDINYVLDYDENCEFGADIYTTFYMKDRSEFLSIIKKRLGSGTGDPDYIALVIMANLMYLSLAEIIEGLSNPVHTRLTEILNKVIK